VSPGVDQAGRVEGLRSVNRLVERERLPVGPPVFARDEARDVAAGTVRPGQQPGSRETAAGCTVGSPLARSLNQIPTSAAGFRQGDDPSVNLDEASL